MKSKCIGIDARFFLRPLRGIPLYVTRLCQLVPTLNREYQFIYFINRAYEHNEKNEDNEIIIEKISRQNDNVIFINQDDNAEIMWEQNHLPRLLKKYDVGLLHMPANTTCYTGTIPTVVTIHDVMEYIFFASTI